MSLFFEQDFKLLQQALETLNLGFKDLPPWAEFQALENQTIQDILIQTAQKLQDNYPYHHPLYAGQMLKPPHRLARLAYTLALYLNPNNHALDGGRASSAMEKQACQILMDKLLQWPENQGLGHLCSSGTIANLEALWVAKQCQGPQILASDQAHYTHSRLAQVLGLSFESLPSETDFRINLAALVQKLEQGWRGTLVLTLGTTGAGAIDALDQALKLRAIYPDFRIHVDAAYGGYFGLCPLLDPAGEAAFKVLGQADSIAIDPHKQGLQPYGCGAIFFRDAQVGRFYRHDSPYTYFSSAELHLGEISLECSRAGAAAVAVWASLQAFPLVADGLFAQALAASRRAALSLHDYLEQSPHWLSLGRPQTDIVLWTYQAKGLSLSELSECNRQIFERAAKEHQLHLALFQVKIDKLPTQQTWSIDQEHLTCLRSCLMKPEHEAFIPDMSRILDSLVLNLNFSA